MSFGRWRSGVREKTGLNRRLSGRGSNQSSSTNILSCTANRVAAQAFPSASCVKWGYSAGLRPRMGETQTMAPAKTAEELTTGEQEITKTNGQKRGSRKTCSRDERKKRGRGRFERWEGRRRTGRVEDGGRTGGLDVGLYQALSGNTAPITKSLPAENSLETAVPERKCGAKPRLELQGTIVCNFGRNKRYRLYGSMVRYGTIRSDT
ncbi:hypothetical protein ACO22_01711 [Paracoccidioides brasiliensis]|uniref:Uncharacterized protein n=1 Tax=Paracoccidioides brasiliensis TaxID=121759 RepID=A0A1D2JL29_PARBR|nr:hypothetical protein ACO22_01711 [Paracoccidioides brasiliensis]